MSYVLGIDLGAQSVGWAMLELAPNGESSRIVKLGVRCFEAGVEGNIEKGKSVSRALNRRIKRLSRRQIGRRARRRKKLFAELQKAGLLPHGPSRTPRDRHELMVGLDNVLRQEFVDQGNPAAMHLLPYLLRAAASHRELQAFAVGRALYHLAHRRGYQTNQRELSKANQSGTDGEDHMENAANDSPGKVKSGISELEQAMGGRTLGEYFSTLNPEEQRIRKRWTSRKMYHDEFAKIWEQQAVFHPNVMTPDLQRKLWKTIFYQRPLKSAKGLVGKCSLELKQRRANQAHPVAQEFRLLAQLNNLRLGPKQGAKRLLSSAERASVIAELNAKGDLTFAKLRKLDCFKKAGPKAKLEFNLEEGGEKHLIGHRTNQELQAIFGERWWGMSDADRVAVVLDVLHYRKRDALIRRACNYWNLNADRAEKLADLSLEPGYANLSLKAMLALLPHLHAGLTYAEAKKLVYPNADSALGAFELLPPVVKALGDVKNPAVVRALTELRKVVNAIVRQYGKPDLIRIELARDIKQSKRERDSYQKRIKEQTSRRASALKGVQKHLAGYAGRAGFDRNIEKFLLWEECGGVCPYTGKCIALQDLLGPSPQFDIEHIFPRRYLDNSFVNKTLCYHEENRNRKRDRLPWEAYGADADRWNEILTRVRAFKGTAARIKLERFMQQEVRSDFVDRQLNDTRYNCVKAAEYLGMLYGGRVDQNGKQRIQTVAGQITATFRRLWKLNGLFAQGDGRGEGKGRDVDHRHHAVDAAVVALVTPGAVQNLSRAAALAGAQRLQRDFDELPPPWPSLVPDLKAALSGVVVSWRVDHRLSGPLHAETVYAGVQGEKARVRKPLAALSENEIQGDAIVDPRIRAIVQAKFRELGGGDPKKVFAPPQNHPALPTKDGRQIPIHKVRVFVSARPFPVGKEAFRTRLVDSGADTNHHVEVIAELDMQGKETKWIVEVVSMREAYRRLAEARRNGVAKGAEVAICKDCGPNRQFKFALFKGDCVMMDHRETREVYRLKSVSEGDLEFQFHSDARDSKAMKEQRARVRKGARNLMMSRAALVRVSELGEVRELNINLTPRKLD